MEAFIHGEFTKNDKSWSDTPTSVRATLFGEGLFKAEYARQKHKHAFSSGLCIYLQRLVPTLQTPRYPSL